MNRRPYNPAAQLTTRGGTRRWDQLKNRVVREEPLCRLRLPGCTIRSQTADHIIPRSHRPDLTMHRPNLRGVCMSCNRRRGTMTPRQMAALRQPQKPARALGFFR